MTTHIKTAPPNSLILIAASLSADIPDSMGKNAIAATPSAVAVGCLMSQDGETEIILGRSSEVDPGAKPSFDGTIETPNRTIAVWTVESKRLLRANVPSTRTRVRVWRNHPTEPNRIAVGWG